MVVVPVLVVAAVLLFPSCPAQEALLREDRWDLDELVTYGTWIRVEPFGTVWKPMVTEDWQPYLYGHWLYGDDAWTWISYEPFGWVVYHYGDWYNDPVEGWVWIPVRGIWSPARVEWRTFGNSVCWAPIPPEGFRLPEPWDVQGASVWVVVGRRDFTGENVGKVRTRIDHPPDTLLTGEPEMADIMASGAQVRRQRIERVPVHLGEMEIQKLDLPSGETDIIEHHRRDVDRHVLRQAGRGTK